MAGVVDQPEPGYYCSADPALIHWQLDALADAGVQALFVSWWGWGDVNLYGVIEGHPDTYLNRGIQVLLHEITAMQRPISVSLIVEPFVQTQTQGAITPSLLLPAQRALVLDWLWANYYWREEYRNLWFQWDGKPLLLAFDPMTLTTALAPITPISYTVRHWTGCARSSSTPGISTASRRTSSRRSPRRRGPASAAAMWNGRGRTTRRCAPGGPLSRQATALTCPRCSGSCCPQAMDATAQPQA